MTLPQIVKDSFILFLLSLVPYSNAPTAHHKITWHPVPD